MSKNRPASGTAPSAPSRAGGGARLSRRVIKVMGMFAGLQSLGIICSIVKMKIVSICLQASGVALFGILSTAQETIATFTDLGLRQSTVRDVASNARDASRLARVAMLVRRWSVLAGLLGATVMVSLSPLLGKWFFNSFGGCLPFALVGVAMFFNCLLYGEQSLLQGTGQLKDLARATLWGTLVGLGVSIPMFRWLGMQSVPLSFIAYSVAIWGFVMLYRYRPPQKAAAPGLRQLWREGESFVRLGILMSMAAFLTSVSRLVFVAILTRVASLEMTGLFQAGDTLVSRYVGLIFTAIGMEFFPRIVSCAHSGRRMSVYVSHETLLLLSVVTPVALVFILSRGLIVRLLYSSEFLPVVSFISLAMTGTVLKTLSWCLGLCIVSRGDGRTYILTEGIDAMLSLGLLTAGYFIAGLDGVGWGYILWNLGYVAIVWTACRVRYGVEPSPGALRATLLAVLMCAGACASMAWLPLWVSIVYTIACCCGWIIPLRRFLAK